MKIISKQSIKKQYKNFIEYIKEEWESRNISNLEYDGLVIRLDDTIEKGVLTQHLRPLTEEEYINSKWFIQ